MSGGNKAITGILAAAGVLLVGTLAPAGAAAPQLAAAEAPGARVARLARRLLLANAPRCAKRRWDYGLYAHRDHDPMAQASGSPRAAPAEPDGFGVIRLWPDGPAEHSGLRLGDRLIAANGAAWSSAGFGEVFRRAEQGDPDLAQLTLEVARGDQVRRVTIAGQASCAAYAVLVPRGKVNASANGTTAFINSGLEQALPADDELSAVIAHELAHIILGHAPALQGDRASRPDRRQIEQDADALGVRLVLGAGIDPAAAVRAVATIGEKSRGPISRLLGLYGAYLSTPERQRFLGAQIAAARAEGAAMPPADDPGAPR